MKGQFHFRRRVEQARVADRGVDRGVGEQGEQQRPDQAAQEVHGDDVEAGVEAERLLDAERQVADGARGEADQAPHEPV